MGEHYYVDPSRLTDPADPSILCSICGGVLWTPTVASCGHHFCEFCILSHFQESGDDLNCPVCSGDFGEGFQAIPEELRTLLRGARIRCMKASAGCRFIGTLDTIRSHEATCRGSSSVAAEKEKEAAEVVSIFDTLAEKTEDEKKEKAVAVGETKKTAEGETTATGKSVDSVSSSAASPPLPTVTVSGGRCERCRLLVVPPDDPKSHRCIPSLRSYIESLFKRIADLEEQTTKRRG